MDRRLAYMILHTGKPYFRAAIEAMCPQVDTILILYSAKPSQGYTTDLVPPDTRDELRQLCPEAVWIEGEWRNEVEHTEAVKTYVGGYDWLIRFDSDEIFPPGIVDEMISQANETKFKRYRIPFVHFWRSFSRVCRDSSHPIRLERVGTADNSQTPTLDSKGGKYVVYHGGYAQPTKYIKYKMETSGHKTEWRPNWFKDRWLANAQEDVHPVMFPTHWHTEDFDKNLLPEVLKNHPYFDMEVIE